MTRRSNWDISAFLDHFSKRQGWSNISNLGLGEIAKGGLTTFLGLSFSIAINFTLQLILTRTLGSVGVGLYNLSFTIVSLVCMVVLFGLDRGAVHYVAYYLAKGDRERELGVVFSSLKTLGIIILLTVPVFWIGADNIAGQIFNKPDLAPVLRIFILSVPFVTLTRLSTGIFQGYKHIRLMIFIEQIFIPALNIIGVLAIILAIGYSLTLVAYSYLYASIAGCGLALILLWHTCASRKGEGIPIPGYSELLSFSWPILFIGLLNRANTYTETLILGGLSSSEQVGIFTVSFKVAASLTIFFESINLILAPFITEAHAKGDSNRLAIQFKTVTRWAFTLTFPIALITLLEAPTIMLVFGPEFVPGAPILQILVLAQIAYILFGLSAVTLTMTGHSHLNLLNLILTFLFSLLLDFILIPKFGAYGAAIAGASALVFLNSLRLAQVFHTLHIHPLDRNLIKPVIAGATSAFITIWLRSFFLDSFYLWRLIIISVILLMIYASLMATLQGIGKYSS